MKEHMADLAFLAKKYQELIKSLEDQIAEAKRKFAVVSEVVELLRKEGIFEQEELFQFQPIISDRFKDMSMTEAIEDILKSDQLNKASGKDILSELQKNGFKSDSKNLKRDVYTRLFRLRQKGKLILLKGKGIKKYSLPKKEEEKITEKI